MIALQQNKSFKADAVNRASKFRRYVCLPLGYCFILLIFMSSCTVNKNHLATDLSNLDLQELRSQRGKIYSETRALKIRLDCHTNAQCLSVPYGNKACGGPIDHFIYSRFTKLSIKNKLKENAALLTAIDKELGLKEQRFSNCQFNNAPAQVCKNYRCIGPEYRMIDNET